MQVKCIKNNFKVESREEKGGRSAWTLCSGLPLRRARARQPRTTLSFLLPSPYLDRRARARQPRTFPYLLLPSPYLTGSPKRASHALFPTFFSLLPTLEAHCIVATHYPLIPSPFSLPYRLARARQPRTFPYLLIPSPYLGSPLHSGHALPSLPLSLLPTLEAHCIVATHFSLPSYPFSLLAACVPGLLSGGEHLFRDILRDRRIV